MGNFRCTVQDLVFVVLQGDNLSKIEVFLQVVE